MDNCLNQEENKESVLTTIEIANIQNKSESEDNKLVG